MARQMAAAALITGALSDIGQATARELARAGLAIALDHRGRLLRRIKW